MESADPIKLDYLAKEWYLQDKPAYDVSGTLFADEEGRAHIYCLQSCRLSGIPFVDAVVKTMKCTAHWHFKEGDTIEVEDGEQVLVAVLEGQIESLLHAERIAINCISRTSGIATMTTKLVNLVASKGFSTKLAQTRQTTPGFSLAEKHAVGVGGGDRYRYDLTILLKDNHVKAFGRLGGGLAKAVKMTRDIIGAYTSLEMDATSREDAEAACDTEIDLIILDGFTADDAKSTAARLKVKRPKLIVECTGGITEDNLLDYCSNDVDIITLECLTQGYPAIGFKMVLV